MDKHIRTLLNRLSCASITIATFTLILLLIETPETCISDSDPKPSIKFPKSSCDSTHRELVSIEKKNKRTWSTNDWRKKVESLTQFFHEIQNLGFLTNHSKVICVSAGAGHEVMALTKMGVIDVTGVELIDSPPLVSRADPHNLPFFDGVFDLGFTAHLAEALFPNRFVAELERTVRPGGVSVVVVEECSDDELREIKGLFKRSSFVSARNVTLIGLKMTEIIMRNRIPP
ncbi:Methyltransferase type 11 [Macleaya cordata]|uniref:Methyltransferase type 11 n=1 Tax=Macleaya cordata TaxID=56857 RepID=A0A200QY32_MACCD|nr:Methyltransferase type 11 [Macleaya cordata]